VPVTHPSQIVSRKSPQITTSTIFWIFAAECQANLQDLVVLGGALIFQVPLLERNDPMALRGEGQSNARKFEVYRYEGALGQLFQEPRKVGLEVVTIDVHLADGWY
jgi:hypothetical protein